MTVFDLDYENLEYGYRMDGPNCPADGHCFDSSVVLSGTRAGSPPRSCRPAWSSPSMVVRTCTPCFGPLCAWRS
jgi:hypothetical protein